MAAKITISLTCCDYDRTRALFDGRVGIEGCEVVAVPHEPEEAFHRAFKFQEYDVTELSLSSHTLVTARGENHYVGVPAFVSRLFRHSSIYIRTDRGIRTPQDLRGKTVGTPEYQMTAALWVRGILEDEYGIRPSEVHWRNGGLEEAGREERATLKLPPEIDLKAIPHDRTLSDMLEKGEIDAVIAARAPSCYDRGAPNVDRLFPDYPAVEKEYFRRTGIFPIMHLIGVRKSIAEKHPWLPVNVLKAFNAAKALCMHEKSEIGHLFTTLPWPIAAFKEAVALMGDDYWSYGFAPNRKTLDAITRYSHEGGLSARRVQPEELFWPATLDLTKI
jgi:4,5-dihydroxyphthalate decarboxylase